MTTKPAELYIGRMANDGQVRIDFRSGSTILIRAEIYLTDFTRALFGEAAVKVERISGHWPRLARYVKAIELIHTISRMTPVVSNGVEEIGVNADDAIETMNRLIQESRQIVGGGDAE